ncbi:uncharacterized protein CELE_C13B7.6 [Caenorhabditis elegans]|uniref:Uncharacterized protein n=1 Tax=Caenorhabditis elegans TaxID=6239 RepID=Q95X12_CAEEL|nr:Uncharacterized protein CELE_Y45G12C.16 [Caenorhabditis elegans]NP_503664.1 Uncharacterized protein CELE_C13B7.6 [Caenorhabditis elegans]CCD62310.2 Uncharacterized protein CELE_Y45G12C.16 [Caenorhabditis elegans]CCD64357.1 Uncharacterized protein CELE_C13B7.6 [Caenorhabditis elegans]|eukprot:NP_001024241.2 Uncharacterized protein CELE_Y45G12C.16 [Caenorhabditis elegans]
MPKNQEDSEEKGEKDEQTAKFLHKLAENGKDRGLPDCVVAQYEKNAWEATNSDEKYKSCEKCGMPPPPPIDGAKNSVVEEVCKNCETINEKPIGIESQILEKRRNEEILKRKEERKSLKRSAEESVTNSAPEKIQKKVHVKIMPRKCAPQILRRSLVPPPILTPKSAKKKLKLAENKEPDFLKALLNVTGNPV